jgi:hypothetical protein
MIHTGIRLRPVLALGIIAIVIGHDNRHAHRCRQKSAERRKHEEPPCISMSSMAEEVHLRCGQKK